MHELMADYVANRPLECVSRYGSGGLLLLVRMG